MSEDKKAVIGRPSLGDTKKVSITLPEEVWNQLDQLQEESGSKTRSELLRRVIFNVLGVEQ